MFSCGWLFIGCLSGCLSPCNNILVRKSCQNFIWGKIKRSKLPTTIKLKIHSTIITNSDLIQQRLEAYNVMRVLYITEFESMLTSISSLLTLPHPLSLSLGPRAGSGRCGPGVSLSAGARHSVQLSWGWPVSLPACRTRVPACLPQ